VAFLGVFRDIPDRARFSFQRFFPARRIAGGPRPYGRYPAAIPSAAHYSRKYFKAMYAARLPASIGSGCLPPFLRNAPDSFWRIGGILRKAPGFTPYNRLKTTALAPSSLFPFPRRHYTVLVVVKIMDIVWAVPHITGLCFADRWADRIPSK
jgi:hypothetical protein